MVQGSWHFWFKQAWLEGHSLLLEHSGLQYGGEPVKFGKQVHDGIPDKSLHIEFGPHGDGVHGVISATGAPKITKWIFNQMFKY